MIQQDIVDWMSKSDFITPPTTRTDTKKLQEDGDDAYYELPSPPETSNARRSKRRRLVMSAEDQRTPKRRRQPDEEEADVDETPRASSSRHGKRSHPRLSPSRSESQTSSQSNASSRSSPSKQIAALEINLDGIQTRAMSLTDDSMPISLRRLLTDMDKCSNGLRILSEELRAEIEKHNEQQEFGEFSTVEDWAYGDAQTRNQLGPTPSTRCVARLVSEAKKCQNTVQNEAGWNMMVHYPVLYEAVCSEELRQLVGVTPCTTAKIIKEYLPLQSQPKMVDFSLCLQPEHDVFPEAPVDAIRQLRQALPYNVINHTDFLPLRSHPITVSIETKRRGTGSEGAELQLGTWHAAQWNFLQDRIAATGGSFEGLDLLPAIVIEGHRWSFAATTRKGRKTVLWLEKPFGSTEGSLGVYKIVWGLQRLARWSECVFWPWYKKNVLAV